MFGRYNILILLCLFVMIFACDSGRQYDISIKNVSSATINDAHIIFDDFYSIGGIIPPGRRAMHLRPNHRLPNTVLVQWKTEDNIFHKKNIKIDLPHKFKGEIRFDIGTQEKVTVHYIPWD